MIKENLYLRIDYMDSNLLLNVMMKTPLCEIAEWDRILRGKSKYTILNEDERKIRLAIDTIIHVATHPTRIQVEKRNTHYLH